MIGVRRKKKGKCEEIHKKGRMRQLIKRRDKKKKKKKKKERIEEREKKKDKGRIRVRKIQTFKS